MARAFELTLITIGAFTVGVVLGGVALAATGRLSVEVTSSKSEQEAE